MKAIFIGGKYHGQIMDIEEVEKISNGQRSANWSEERARGQCVPRAELDSRPLVDGYVVPMWDGDKIRYESYDVYEVLSR